jgi:hypothetical protein
MRPDTEKCVASLARENIGDNVSHGHVFANMAGREIGWNNSLGLSVRDCRNRL